MEQFDLLEMDQQFECLYCLPDLPQKQNQDDPRVVRLVVETTNYRVEIEIG